LLSQRELTPATFDPAMVADLPEIGQRYFANAIVPGTPLHRVARLEMEGSLILNGRELPMRADQILAPPHGFVWRARAGSGLIRFSGSDGFWNGDTSWTRFWLWGVLPVARIADTEDHARAAAARNGDGDRVGAGRVLEMTTLRWSDAHPDRIYRLQPFGGRMLAHATHQGFTIPTAMEIGNLYGTPEYAPFFRARVTRVEYCYSGELHAAPHAPGIH
jgi:hypothetical protein